MKRMTVLFLSGLLILLIFAGCRVTVPAVTTTQAPVVTTTTTTPPPTTTIPATTGPPTTAPRPVGWTERDGRLYYYTEDSVMLTGWQVNDLSSS